MSLVIFCGCFCTQQVNVGHRTQHKDTQHNSKMCSDEYRNLASLLYVVILRSLSFFFRPIQQTTLLLLQDGVYLTPLVFKLSLDGCYLSIVLSSQPRLQGD